MKGKIVTINLSGIRDALKAQQVAMTDGQALTVAARGVANTLKKHFRANNTKPNKNGYDKTNLWAAIRDTVHSRRDGNGAVVEVNDPRFNLKVYGGNIRPKRGKAIAIPLSDAAYGKSPKNVENLFMIKSRGKALLVRKVDPASKVFEAMYLLLKGTYVPPDPQALPPKADIEKSGVEAAISWWQRELKK